MNEKINKTSIGCILFLDIIDYSTKSVSEQIDVKNHFNSLINYSLKDIAQNDRIILDTGDGAAIALLGAPEDALFVALNIRDGILKTNARRSMPLLARFGINLGPIRIVNDINSQLNIVGDGINVAQRIMSFAKPNQIIVSRSYYDIASRLTKEISQLFEYAGIKRDKHEREHEIYGVITGKEKTTSLSLGGFQLNIQEYWKYVFFGFMVFLILVFWFSAVLKSARLPEKPVAIVTKPALQSVPTPTVNGRIPQKMNLETSLSNERISPANTEKVTSANSQESTLALANDDALTKKNAIKKHVKKKAADMPEPYEPPKSLEHHENKNTVVAPEYVKIQPESGHDPSVWKALTESVKQGQEHHRCTQAEIALAQCR